MNSYTSTTRSRPAWIRKVGSLLTVGGLVASALVAAGLTTAPAAHAAPGDPFDPSIAQVFVAQGAPTTRLFVAATNGSGETTFTPEGGAATTQYNAIGFNTANNYLYGITNVAAGGIPAQSFVRIGEGNVVTRVGTSTFNNSVLGAFGPADGYYYSYIAPFGNAALQVINPATGALVRTTPLTGATVTGSDFTFADGFFWSAHPLNGISRTDPATGVTVSFPNSFILPTEPQTAGNTAGAAWTYGNGNLGFSFNTSGNVYQVDVTNPASATPTFTRIAVNPGPASA